MSNIIIRESHPLEYRCQDHTALIGGISVFNQNGERTMNYETTPKRLVFDLELAKMPYHPSIEHWGGQNDENEADCFPEPLSETEAEIAQLKLDYRVTRDELEFCVESTWLMEHHMSYNKKLFARSFNHLQPSLRAKREYQQEQMIAEMEEGLVYAVWKEPDRDFLQLVNRYYKVPSPEHCDWFISPRDVHQGLPVRFYPVMKLYYAPWRSLQDARAYLRGLHALMAALRSRLATIEKRLKKLGSTWHG